MQRMTFFCPFCQPRDPASPPAPPAEARTRFTATVHTLEEARDFILEVGLCGVLHDPTGKLPTLWDALAFASSGPDSWGEKIGRVWELRRELAASYPGDIFTGTIRGGRVVLMSMEQLRTQYARHHRPLEARGELARQLYGIVSQAPIMTLPLRQAAGLVTRKERGQFARALQELQTTFNIARSPASEEGDVWVPFLAQYPDFAA